MTVRFLFVFFLVSGQPWIWLCVLAEAPGSTLKAMFSCAVSEKNTQCCWHYSLEEVFHRIRRNCQKHLHLISVIIEPLAS